MLNEDIAAFPFNNFFYCFWTESTNLRTVSTKQLEIASYWTGACFKAAEHGHFDVIKEILKRGFRVDFVYKTKTLLLIAIENDNLSLLSFLLKNGASSASTDGLIDPLRVAVQQGNLSKAIVECLLKHGAAMGSAYRNSYLYLTSAAKCRHMAMVKYLLTVSMPVDGIGGELEETALHFATRNRNLELMELFLSGYNNRSLRLDKKGHSPWYIAKDDLELRSIFEK